MNTHPSILFATFASATSLALALTPALACAQTAPHETQCPGGRVVTARTAGRCCWPAQSWDAEHDRCTDPPTCPADLVAHGDDCVSVSPAEESPAERIARAVEEDRARMARRTIVPYSGGPVPAGHHVVNRGGTLLGAGGLLLFMGVLPAVSFGLYGAAAGNAQMPLAWSFAPLVGMPIAVFSCGPSLCGMPPGAYLAFSAAGFVASALQTTGLILTLVGGSLAANAHVVPDAPASARWQVTPWSDGVHAAGIALTVHAM